MLLRWVGSLLDFIVDVAMSSPRKGSIVPPEVVPAEEDIAPVRARVASDLLNYGGGCKCMDCVCGFNKPDPNAKPGRSVES